MPPGGFEGSEAGGMMTPPQMRMESGEGMPGAPPASASGNKSSLPSLGAASGSQGFQLGVAPGGTEGGAMPGAAGGGMFVGQDLSGIVSYTESQGGGTIAVASQSEASSSIIESGAEVAGIGGFSGKETSVSTSWLEEAVASGRIRRILSGGGITGGPGGQFGGDTRQGSESAIAAVTATCTEVPSSAYAESGEGSGEETSGQGATTTSQILYDCGP
jgi:hypothetical protein